MTKCAACGYHNEGMTAYCRRCVAVMPQEGLPSAPIIYRPVHDEVPVARTVSPPSTLGDRLSRSPVAPFWRRHWPKLFLLVAIGGCLVATGVFLKPEKRLSRKGHRFSVFALDDKPRFFAGLDQNVNVWSEHQGSLDAKILSLQALETGVLHARASTASKIRIDAASWIRTEQHPGGEGSETIPLTDPSLASVEVRVAANRQLKERYAGSATRTGTFLSFVFPRFPDRPLAHHDTWQEQTEWLDPMGDWTLRWDVKLDWKLVNYERCGDSYCARFSYQGALEPEVKQSPRWTEGSVQRTRFTGRGIGEALVDTATNQILENEFLYEGDLKVSLSDLRRIPERYRLFPLPEATPGELIFRIKNKISVTRP